MRIVFAGTPEFAVHTLEALANSGHNVVGVLTQPDRPAGRGRRLQASPVKQFAQSLNIPVRQPESLKHPSMHAEIRDWQPDLMVVVAYGLLLPQAVLDIPRLACVNVHASLLPRWRGAAPIQYAILAGDTETGITIMKMEAGLDTGPMLTQVICPLDPRDTAAVLHDRLAELGAKTMAELLPRLEASLESAQPQDDSQSCYAPKINKAMARLDWQMSAAELNRAVLAWNAWPVAHSKLNGEPLRVWAAEMAPAIDNASPGEIHCSADKGIRVATGAGALRLTELQFAGGRRMSAEEAMRGRDLDGQKFDQNPEPTIENSH